MNMTAVLGKFLEFASIAIPLVIFFKLLRIHPNWVTFISFVTLFLSSYFSIIGSFAFAGIFIIITFVLDCVDGILARINNQQSCLLYTSDAADE